MDKLKAIFQDYLEAKLLSNQTTFEQFALVDDSIKEVLYNQGIENKVISSKTDLELFKSAWSDTDIPTVKKKDEGMGLPLEDGSSVSSETDVISQGDLLQNTITPSDRLTNKPTDTQIDYELGFQNVSKQQENKQLVGAGTMFGEKPPKRFSEPVEEGGVSVSEEVEYDSFQESIDKVVNKELVSNDIASFLMPFTSILTRPDATEENVIPKMQYYFGEYGFKFEPADVFGDGMTVKAGNGKETYVNLDQVFGGDKSAEDLKTFLIKNKQDNFIESKEEKIYDEKEIKDAVGVFNTQSQEWSNAYNALISLEDSNKKMKDEFDGLSEDSDFSGPDYEIKLDTYNQNLAAEKKLFDLVKDKGELIEANGVKLDRLAGQYYEMKSNQGGYLKGIVSGIFNRGPANIASGAVSYGVDAYTYLAKNHSLTDQKYREELIRIAKDEGYLPKDEDFSSVSKEEIIERLGGDTNDAMSLLGDVAYNIKNPIQVPGVPAKIDKRTNFDKVDDKIKDYARKGIKYYNDYGVEGLDYDKAVEGKYRNPVSQIASNIDTEMGVVDASREIGEEFSKNIGATKEWADLEKQGFWGGAVLGLSESIPAMVGGMDKIGFAQRTAQMFMMTSSHVDNEMDKNPMFDNISESEKTPIKVSISTVSAVLESLGFRNVMSKNSYIATAILSRVLKKVPPGASRKTLRNFISQDIESSLARGGYTLLAAGAAEFETGFAQQGNEIYFKNVYNELKDKKMFTTPESWWDITSEMLYAGAQEAVGGFILGSPGAVSSAVSGQDVQSLDERDWKNFELMSEDPTYKAMYVQKLKTEIANPKNKKTLEDAKAELESVNKIQGLLESNKQYIGDYSPEQKKRAVQLLLQKQELENEIKNGDKVLSKSKQNLLEKVNNDLDFLAKESLSIQSSLDLQEEGIQDFTGNILDWIKGLGKTKDIGDVMEGGIEVDMDGTKVIMTEKDGGVVLESIETPENDRGQGKADASIKEITQRADKDGVKITLKVAPKDATVDAKRLEKFYARNGFEMQEDGTTMVRNPNTQEQTQEQKDIEEFFSEDVDDDIEKQSKNLSINRKNDNNQKNKSPFRSSAITAAKLAARAIRVIAPNVRIVLHESESEYLKYVTPPNDNEGVSSGEYSNNVIHINLSNVKKSTVAHEVFHAVLLTKLKDNDALAKKISDDMVRVVQRRLPKENKLRIAVEAHAANYVGEQAKFQTEEQIAELIGLLSSKEFGYTKLEGTIKLVIKNYLMNLAKKLGISLPNNWGNDQEVVDLINTLARKTRTGEAITESDVKLLDVKEDAEDGGEFVENPANSLRQQKVGDFEVTYTEDDKIAQYVKDGRITEPKDILDIFKDLNISNVEVLVHSPDDMLAGEIKYKGETIFEGSGGVFFVTKFGEVWASTEDAANQIVKGLNKQVEEQGKGVMLLTKGTDQKLMSSPTGVDGAIKVIGKMLEAKIFSLSQFRTAVSEAVYEEQNRLTIKAKKDGKKAPKFKPFSLKESAAGMMSDITRLFSDESSGTFETRGNIVKGIGNALVRGKLTSEQQSKAAKFLGGDTARSVGVSSTENKKTGNPLSQGLSDLIALTLAEKLTKGLKTGDVYAVIEVNQKVKATKSKHPSYDTSIVTLDGNPPILHLLKNRQPGKEVLTPIFGKDKNKPYSVRQVPTMTGQINLEKKAEDKGTNPIVNPTPIVKPKSRQPATRQQNKSPKFVQDLSVLLSPATVRNSNKITGRLKKLSLRYNDLVNELQSNETSEKLSELKELEAQILNEPKQEIISQFSEIEGVSVRFGPNQIGLWNGVYEPSFSMNIMVTPQADSKKVSKVLLNFAEKYSQDSFILEAESPRDKDFKEGKILIPLTEELGNGIIEYPQISYIFTKRLTDGQVQELSKSIKENGINAFSINNNELKISSISDKKKYNEKREEFEQTQQAAAESILLLLGRNEALGGVVNIKRSHYVGSRFDGNETEVTRPYDKRDVFKPFKERITFAELSTIELRKLRKEQILLSKQKKQLSPQKQARLDELTSIIQPVVENTIKLNKSLYEKAKKEVESIAEEATKDVNSFVSYFDIKNPKRASVKVLRWYNSFTEKLGDGARVNIIVEDSGDVDKIFNTIDKNNPVNKNSEIRRINKKTELGYPKRLIEIKTSNGIIAEIQVMSPEGYLAKDGKKYFDNSNPALASELLSKIREKLRFPIPDGLGHYFYEINRDLNVSEDLRKESERLSNIYYNVMIDPNAKTDESFMDDIIKFKEKVDKSDKSTWDKGNDAIAPPSLNEYIAQNGSKKTFTARQDKSAKDYISKGRESNFSDEVIRDYLVRVRKFSAKKVDELLSLPITIFEKMPKSFGNIKDGANSGMKLFKRVDDYYNKLYNNNKKRKPQNQITNQEILDKTIEFLQNQPEYINESETYTKGSKKKGTQRTLNRNLITLRQAAMLADMQSYVGISPSKNMGIKIAKARLILQQYKKRKINLDKVKKELRNFLRKSLPKELYEKKDVLELIDEINAADEKNISNILESIELFVNKKNAKSLKDKIKSILNAKYVVKENGTSKGKLVDITTKKIIEYINKNILSENATEEEIRNQNEKLERIYNETFEQIKQSDEFMDLLVGSQLAIMYNESLLSDDIETRKVQALDEIHMNLNDLRARGRTLLNVQLKEAHDKYIRTLALGYEAITGEKIDMAADDALSKLELSKKKRKSDDSRKKRTQTVVRKFISKMMQDIEVNIFAKGEALDGLMMRIDKLPGELFGGRLNEEFTNKVDESSRRYKGRMMMIDNIVKNYLIDLYGNKWKAITRKNRVQKSLNIELHDGIMLEDLSQDQIAYLYNMYKDPSNKGAFENMFGVEVINPKIDTKDEIERKNKVNKKNTERVMKELISKLDPKVKELADWQVDVFYPSLYEEYNSTHKKLYRTELPQNDFYAGTIYREGVSDEDTNLLKSGSRFNAPNPSATKARQKNNLPIKYMNMMDVLDTYVNSMEHFAAYGETIRDMDKFFKNKYVKDAIISIHGEKIYNLIAGDNGTINKIASRDIRTTNTANAMNTIFVVGRISLSPLIVIKQLTSMFTYMNDIGHANWILYSAKNKAEQLKVWKEVSNNSVYMKDRASKSILRAIETYSESSVREFVPSKFEGMGEWLIDFMMYTTKFGDRTAIMLGGLPNYSYYKAEFKKSNPNATEQEAIDHAIIKFERDTKRTQQSSDLQDKDSYQTKDSIYRGLNMFLTTPKQYLRKEIIATRELYRIISKWDSKAGKGTILQNVNTLLMYHVYMPVLFQYVSMGLPGILRGFRDDDDEDLLRAAIIGNLNAIFIYGEVIQMMGDLFTNKPWAGSQVRTVGAIQIAAGITKDMARAKNLKDPVKKQKAWMDAFLELATITSIPAPTLKKLFENYSNLNSDEDIGILILRLLNYSKYQIEGSSKGNGESKIKTISELNEEYHKKEEKTNTKAQKDRIGFYD